MDTITMSRTHMRQKQSAKNRISQTIKTKMRARSMTKMIRTSTFDIRKFPKKWMLLYLKPR